MSKTNPNLPAFRRFAAAGLASLLPLAGAFAQEEEDDDIFTLTPFEVDAEEDTGYRATSTLAGTRMRMSLDDVGSSVSVFTEELMDDLAALDNETLLAYGLGTEVGGARGNFVNPGTEGLENDNLLFPQNNNRVRGLTSADTTRNFFKSDVPWDGYNTNRIDVQRGPNSILFGLGSPAGIINNTTSSAGFTNGGELELRYDQFGSLRAALDYNQVLLEDELAVRVSLLRDSKEFRQQPAFEDDERIFAAVTYQPKMLNTETITTRFSANFEHGEIEANRPRFVVPLDQVSSFFDTGNGFEGADFANDGKYGPSTPIIGNAGQARDQIAENSFIEDDNPFLTSPFNPWPIATFDALNPGSFTLAEDGFNSQGAFLVLNDPNSDDQAVVVNDGGFVNPFATRARDVFVRDDENNVFGIPRVTTIGKQRVASDNGVAFPGFWRDPSLSSTDQFDFMNHLIDGNNKLEEQEFDVFEFQVRNTFFNNRLGYQLSYFRQEMDVRQDANLGAIFAPAIQVDAGALDPLSPDPLNPLPNPTAGRAFVDFELRLRGGFEDNRDRDERQIQLFATLDSRDFMEDGLMAQILGKHDFTGLIKNRRFTRLRREFNSTGVDEATIRRFGRLQPDDPNLNPNFDPADADPGPGARAVRLSNAFGSVQPRIRVFLDAEGPNLTQLQPFAEDIFIPEGPQQLRGFVANPKPGFTAQDALAEWISPVGDEEEQANNPANYTGVVDNKGTLTFVKATDSREALEFLTSRRFFDQEDIDSEAIVWNGTFMNGAVVGMYGWREDDATQFSLEHSFGDLPDRNDEGRTFGPNFDPSSDFRRTSKGSFQSRNWSVKANVTKLFFDTTGMDDSWLPFDVSILFNEGEVQNPQPGRRDVLLNDLAPSTGRTIDRSVVLASKDGRYSLRITKFDTIQANANAGSVAASENWRIEQIISNGVSNGSVWIEQGRDVFTDAVLDNGDEIDDPNEINPTRSQEIRDAGFDDVFEWAQFVAADFRDFEAELFTRFPDARSWITGGEPGTDSLSINFPDDTVFIEDNASFGTEFEFFANPTDNWNLTVNASKTEVLRSKVFGDEVNEVLDFIVGRLSGPAGMVPLWGPEGQMLQARVAPFLGQLITNRALLGTPTGELRKWKVNVITNYDFTEGFLEGFGVGGAFRHEDDQVVGFPPILVDPVTGDRLDDRSRSDAALAVDIDRPFTDETRQTVDIWFKYKRKLTDQIDWRIQLNFFNVFNDRGTVPLFRNPDGTIGTRGIREGRSWQLTNTFEF